MTIHYSNEALHNRLNEIANWNIDATNLLIGLINDLLLIQYDHRMKTLTNDQLEKIRDMINFFQNQELTIDNCRYDIVLIRLAFFNNRHLFGNIIKELDVSNDDVINKFKPHQIVAIEDAVIVYWFNNCVTDIVQLF